MGLKGKYAIVGVGYTPQGSIPDRTALSFHVEACANALKDAGLKKNELDGLICYRHFPPSPDEVDVTPYLVAQHLGLSPRYLNQDANCSRSHLLHAVGALEAGLCHYVVVSFGHDALVGGGMRRMLRERAGNEAVFGHFGAPAGYALAARRAMHTFRTGPETWKHIAVGQRRWANLNPMAMMYDRKMSCEDYYRSGWLVEPFRLYDCCLVTDGGRACIVTSLERASDLPNPPAVILGIGQHNPSYDVQQQTNMAGPTGAKIAGETAFRMAEVTIDEIDACQIYDCFTYTVEITLQDYGFFGPGEGEDWF